MSIDADSSDAAVLRELGRRLRALRLARNLTQAELAAQAGVSLPTLARIERGDGAQLVSLLRILRRLDLLAALEELVPEPARSPLANLRDEEGRSRRRASGSRRARGTGDASGWSWGDER